MTKIEVLKREVQVLLVKEEDYICLTDIARYKNQDATDDLIRNWLRNRNTIVVWVFGSKSITPVLNPWNSTGLENRLA